MLLLILVFKNIYENANNCKTGFHKRRVGICSAVVHWTQRDDHIRWSVLQIGSSTSSTHSYRLENYSFKLFTNYKICYTFRLLNEAVIVFYSQPHYQACGTEQSPWALLASVSRWQGGGLVGALVLSILSTWLQ